MFLQCMCLVTATFDYFNNFRSFNNFRFSGQSETNN